MNGCSGVITTAATELPAGTTTQVASSLSNRTRLTVRAGVSNTDTVYLLTAQGANFRDGFPLDPGEGFQFDSVGAGQALYAYAATAGQSVAVVSESG